MGGLTLENIKYAYQDNHFVLKGITSEFKLGQFYAIIGPSGCGKTTLLSLLGGLDTPSSGIIKLHGEDIAKNGLLSYRKHKVSFVFQNFNLLEYLTAEENVRLVTREAAYPILERLGITKEEASRNVLKLSGGQQQRVAIARSLASHSEILLADEPTGNLDEDTSTEIINILKDTTKRLNKCVIVVTHSHELAKQADIVYQLKSGMLEQVEITEMNHHAILSIGN